MSDINYLREYSKLTEYTEVPGIFSIWSALAGLSCVMGRRCWIDMGIYTVYSNLYVVLVASSGRCRKSTSIKITENLLYQLEPTPNLISQKITPEALIEAIKVVQINDDQQFLKESCVGFVVADELNTFLNRKTYEVGLGTILIPLYDCNSHFAYHTKGRGKEVLTDSCLGMLSGTTIDKLKDAIPSEAVGEGLTSRMIFVYCASPSPPVAVTKRTIEQGKTEERLIKFLQKALTLEGKVNLSDEAIEYFEKRYNDFYYNSPLYTNLSLSGYASRRHVHLLKLSMLLAISSRLEIAIELEDIKSADKLLEIIERSMPMLMNIVTASETGKLMQEIYNYIRERKSVSRKELLSRVSHKIDSKHFTDICETLIHSGRISVEASNKDVLLTAL